MTFKGMESKLVEHILFLFGKQTIVTNGNGFFFFFSLNDVENNIRGK